MLDPTQMHWSEFVISAILFAVTACSLSAWVWLFQGRKPGTLLLPYVERTAVPWGMIDIIAVVFIMFLAQSAGVAATSAWGDLGSDSVTIDAISPAKMLSFSLASLATWALSVCFIMTRTGASIADLGCDRPNDLDIRQGAVAFFLLALPVFGVQLVLSQLWQESQHPLIELMETRPETITFLISSFAAVIVAPLVEEFFFRVLVQGWLENIAVLWQLQRRGHSLAAAFPNRLFWGHNRTTAHAIANNLNRDTSAKDEKLVSNTPSEDSLNPYQSPPSPPEMQMTGADINTHVDLTMRPVTWPIFVSAALFAVAHYGNGPDPIPLFILALGLGLLYRQTHRIWPGIVVHMMLNALSMAQLWLHTQSLPVAR